MCQCTNVQNHEYTNNSKRTYVHDACKLLNPVALIKKAALTLLQRQVLWFFNIFLKLILKFTEIENDAVLLLVHAPAKISKLLLQKCMLPYFLPKMKESLFEKFHVLENNLFESKTNTGKQF